MDRAMTIEKTANVYGYPYSFVKEACERAPEEHPLPCIKRGGRRPLCYIQPSTFERWLAEEERRQVGLDDDSLAGLLGKMEEGFDEFAEAIA